MWLNAEFSICIRSFSSFIRKLYETSQEEALCQTCSLREQVLVEDQRQLNCISQEDLKKC